MFGELFNDERSARTEAYQQGLSQILEANGASTDFESISKKSCRSTSDGADFIANHVYRPCPPPISAVGFKLLYGQARKSKSRSVWDALRQDKQLRILHVVRTDLLASLVSLKTALYTSKWVAPAEGAPSLLEPSFHLDPIECARYFRTLQRQRAWVEQYFVDHPKATIRYEDDLVEDFSNTLRRTQEFVGSKALPVRQVVFKQSTLPIRERIVNFGELESYFAASRYKDLFRSEARMLPGK